MMSFQRVWSNLGSSAVKTPETEQNDAVSITSEFTDQATDPSRGVSSGDTTIAPPAAPWMRELHPSGTTRHSRASSIVSTRTKYSTLTLPDDARSIDIHVGGQTFRIARDGSQISDAPPPPYSGPIEIQVLRDGRSTESSGSRTISTNPGSGRTNVFAFRGGRPGGSSVFDHFYGGSEDDQTDQGTETPRQHSRSPSSASVPRPDVSDTSAADMASAVDEGSQRLAVMNDQSETPSRNWSYKAGPDLISVPSEARRLRTVSQNDLPLVNSRRSPPLVRRNGVRLPMLVTDSLDNVQKLETSAEPRFAQAKAHRYSPLTRSAGPVLYTDHEDASSLSPTFIGRDARGIFPRSPVRETLIYNVSESSTRAVSVVHDNEASDENALPLPMDNENDISLHYARLMRKLDRDHRKALHLKDKELEKLRERLNEMDVVYRQELKFRDFVIEDLKKRLDHLQDESEMMAERARNEVEDLWESRWKTQSSKLIERMRRMEEEARAAPVGPTQPNARSEDL